MFAFAIHERTSGRVFLARDRLGIKPLHWAEAGGRFYAASELKSLRGLPGLSLTLDEVAVDQYFSLLYVPAPRTIFREIKKLPPGHLLVKDPGQPAVIRRYWQLHARPDRARSGGRLDRGGAARPRRRGRQPPRRRRAAGGLSLGRRRFERPRRLHVAGRARGRIKTFSIGFPSEYAAFDERPFARQVAARFGTDHQEMEVAPDIGEAMQALGRIFDEPMGDSGAVPNLLVCRMARQHLTVALSGLGGDELAGGYQRYLGVTDRRVVPEDPRLLAERRGAPAGRSHPRVARRGARGSTRRSGSSARASSPSSNGSSPSRARSSATRREALYQPELRARVALDSALERMQALGAEQPDADLLNKILCIDQQTYLVDDLLTVADRTSMAVSLEVRVPFLDHPFVELMAGVPGKLKIRRREKKYLLKRALEADLPPEILHRKKAGFSLPLGALAARGPARDGRRAPRPREAPPAGVV